MTKLKYLGEINRWKKFKNIKLNNPEKKIDLYTVISACLYEINDNYTKSLMKGVKE
jgi:hypothetical protein